MDLVIIEDDPLQRDNLKMLLSCDKGINIVGAYASAEDALQSFKQRAPDVMLTDLGLPGMSGLDFIKNAKREMPSVEIMAHTVFDDRDKLFSALKAGASAYMLKGSSPQELIEAIYALYHGGAPMSPKIARKVICEFCDDQASEPFGLSPQERDILRCIEEGVSYHKIAERLCISPQTVHTEIRNIYVKLQAKDRKDSHRLPQDTQVM